MLSIFDKLLQRALSIFLLPHFLLSKTTQWRAKLLRHVSAPFWLRSIPPWISIILMVYKYNSRSRDIKHSIITAKNNTVPCLLFYILNIVIITILRHFNVLHPNIWTPSFNTLATNMYCHVNFFGMLSAKCRPFRVPPEKNAHLTPSRRHCRTS